MSGYRERSMQPSLFPLPPRFPTHRRMICACGCGCWFYWERRPGRPLEYVSKEHALRALNRRRRETA